MKYEHRNILSYVYLLLIFTGIMLSCFDHIRIQYTLFYRLCNTGKHQIYIHRPLGLQACMYANAYRCPNTTKTPIQCVGTGDPSPGINPQSTQIRVYELAYRWPGAGLCDLRCVSTGDRAVPHQTISMMEIYASAWVLNIALQYIKLPCAMGNK